MTRTSERITYSIHTEYQTGLPGFVGRYLDCFAIFEGTGYWKGVPERAARIDYIGTAMDRTKVEELAHNIRLAYEQEAVYVTSTVAVLVECWGEFQSPYERRSA